MKRFILSLAVSILLIGQSFANEASIPETVMASFQTRFQNAQSITWSDTKDHYTVRFSLNAQPYCAFYAYDGSFIALSRQISVTQLPLLMQESLQKQYKNYTVFSVLELQEENTVSYYVSMENAKTTLIVKTGSCPQWTEFMKTKKK